MGRYTVLEKELIGFKRVLNKQTKEWAVIQIVIPVGATVHFSLFTNKCRASCARVVQCDATYVSHFDQTMEYTLGATIVPLNGFATEEELDKDCQNVTHYTPKRDLKHTCAAGIHFFLDERSANQYHP